MTISKDLSKDSFMSLTTVSLAAWKFCKLTIMFLYIIFFWLSAEQLANIFWLLAQTFQIPALVHAKDSTLYNLSRVCMSYAWTYHF